MAVTNHGPDDARDVQVFLGSPPDLLYLTGPNVPAGGSREVRFDIESLAVGERLAYTATARLDGLPGEALPVQGSVVTVGQMPAVTNLTLDVRRPAGETLSPGGPEESATSLDGRLQIGEGTRSEEAANLSVRLLEWHIPENRRTGRILAFELVAGNQNGRAIEPLAAPVELQLDLTGLITAEEMASGRFRLFSQASGTESWQEVAATLDSGGPIVTFSVSKPGTIQVLENDPRPLPGNQLTTRPVLPSLPAQPPTTTPLPCRLVLAGCNRV